MSSELTLETLADLRTAEQAATPGPWRAEHFESWDDNEDKEIDCGFPWTSRMVDCGEYHTLRWEDAQFCALARNHMPALLDRLERVEALNRLKGADCIDRAEAAERRLESACLSLADSERQLDHERTRRREAEERIETLERELSEAEAGELRQAARVAELECLIWHHEWERNEPVCARCRVRNGHVEGCHWGQAAANHRARQGGGERADG